MKRRRSSRFGSIVALGLLGLVGGCAVAPQRGLVPTQAEDSGSDDDTQALPGPVNYVVGVAFYAPLSLVALAGDLLNLPWTLPAYYATDDHDFIMPLSTGAYDLYDTFTKP